MHRKDIQSTVANAISRLDFGPVQDEKDNGMMFTKIWCHYTMHARTEDSTLICHHQMNMVFANHSKEDVVYLLTAKGNFTSPEG